MNRLRNQQQNLKKPLMVGLSVLAVSVAGSARQIAAQSLNCNQPIDFGTFAACGSNQTATLSPGGGMSTSGCLSPIGSHIAGFCFLTGIIGTTVITAATGLPLSNGAGGTMVVDNILLQPTAGGAAGPSIVITSSMSSPNLNFTVGATLHVSGTQAGGSYTGTYTVTTNYP